MSGPKKADVVAALNLARGTQRACADRISRVETETVRRVLSDADTRVKAAAGDVNAATADARGLDEALRRAAPESVDAARAAAERAQKLAAAARDAVAGGRKQLEEASAIEQRAKELYELAESEYRRAEAAVRGGNEHYMTREMAWAQAAKALYDNAAATIKEAERVRQDAERAATGALGRASEAASAAAEAARLTRSARAAAEARVRAEAEARRIAEDVRRQATLALDGASAAVAALRELPHAEFAPGSVDALARELHDAARLLDGGQPAEADAAARSVEASARRATAEVTEAARAYERRQAEAYAQVAALAAAIESANRALLDAWGPERGALDGAQAALDSARARLLERDPDAAAAIAASANRTLADGGRLAAEAKGQDEQRQQLGDAIMDVLQEMGFDVSYEPGSRTEPLRIAGQTPNMQGRGDFDVAIPLSGEIDFRVEAEAGDTACVAVVKELQERMAERGHGWRTTDWGHAEGVGEGGVMKQRQKEVTHEVEKVTERRGS